MSARVSVTGRDSYALPLPSNLLLRKGLRLTAESDAAVGLDETSALEQATLRA
jgi:hypothetical protein